MSRAIYCRCLNTYVMECKERDCPYPDYWKQGIGKISGDTEEES